MTLQEKWEADDKTREGGLPTTLNVKIIKRAIGETKTRELYEMYKKSRAYDSFNSYSPSKMDIKIYFDWLDDLLTEKQVTIYLRIGRSTVNRRFAHIAKAVAKGEITDPREE